MATQVQGATHRKAAHGPHIPGNQYQAVVSPIVTQALSSARRNGEALGKDQFAAVHPIEGEGMPVTLRLKPDVEYVNGHVKLSVSANNLISPGPQVTFANGSVALGHYSGRNGFGATADVSVNRAFVDNLLLVNRDDDDEEYYYIATLDGPTARALATNTKFIIDGVMAKAKNGKLADCTSNYFGPTLESPVDDVVQRCWVGVQISKMAFVNSATGEIIRSWTEASPVAKYPAINLHDIH